MTEEAPAASDAADERPQSPQGRPRRRPGGAMCDVQPGAATTAATEGGAASDADDGAAAAGATVASSVAEKVAQEVAAEGGRGGMKTKETKKGRA